MKTVQPPNPPSDFNTWINYIFNLIKTNYDNPRN